MPGAMPVASVYDCRAWLFFITLEPKNPAFRQHGKIFLNYVVDEAV